MLRAYLSGFFLDIVVIVVTFEAVPARWQLLGYGLALGLGAFFTSCRSPHHKIFAGTLTMLPVLVYFLLVSALVLPPLSKTHLVASCLIIGSAWLGASLPPLLNQSSRQMTG